MTRQRFADRFPAPDPPDEPRMSPEEWQAKIHADIIGILNEARLVPLPAVFAAIRAVYRPHMGQSPTAEELIEQLKIHLEQQGGDKPL